MVKAGSALGFGHSDASQAKLGGLSECLPRKVTRLIQLARERFHFRFREFAHAFLQQLLLFTQFQIQRKSPSQKTLSIIRHCNLTWTRRALLQVVPDLSTKSCASAANASTMFGKAHFYAGEKTWPEQRLSFCTLSRRMLQSSKRLISRNTCHSPPRNYSVPAKLFFQRQYHRHRAARPNIIALRKFTSPRWKPCELVSLHLEARKPPLMRLQFLPAG